LFFYKNLIDSITKIYCKASLFGKDKLITKFLKKYNLNASEILYVGDETRDIVACQKVGVKIAWVEWGYDTKEAAAAVNPDYLAASPRDILSVFRASLN
jgi:phosphoglycolate phosphatase